MFLALYWFRLGHFQFCAPASSGAGMRDLFIGPVAYQIVSANRAGGYSLFGEDGGLMPGRIVVRRREK